ncbi:Anks1b [Symbiodinium natans]|uniref:Anks1b protein n=1 Tax=Symbiodinium natans TaxID=878477 RepID=A0A812U6J0_9DINO|nr:Anks1b [Symbiodinium natans]
MDAWHLELDEKAAEGEASDLPVHRKARKVAVRMPVLDWSVATRLLDELSFCMKAIGLECQPQLRVPGQPEELPELAVDLWVDTALDGHRLCVQRNHADLAARSQQALFAGVEHLRQLLALHTTCFTGSRLEAVEARLPRLPRLPGLCVHGRCQSSGAFLELWRLDAGERRTALRQLRRWGVRQVWAPVPCVDGASLASLWQTRRMCGELEVEILPILSDAADIKILAQFQGCSQIGCRCRDSAELGELWRRMKSAGLGDSRLTAVLSIEGFGSPQAVQELLHGITVLGIPPTRFAALIETSIEEKVF